MPEASIDELERFLVAGLPAKWAEAVEAGDDDRVVALRADLDVGGFVRRLGEAGWVAPTWAPEHGGRGLTPEAGAEVGRLLDRWGLPRVPEGAGMALAAPTILTWGTEEAKRRFLPPLCSGAERWCQLFSEPGAGSDLASLQTMARPDGDEWVVNGQKVWTTFADFAEMGLLLARTDRRAPKHEGITYFAVDLRNPGVEVRPMRQLTGEREFNEVFFTDVRIPDAHRIGATGEGWKVTQTTLQSERRVLSGPTKKRRSSEEVLGGTSLGQVIDLARRLGALDDPVARDRVVREHVRSRVLSLTLDRFRHLARVGRSTGVEGSLTKLGKARANQSLQLLATDLLGPRATAWAAGDPDAPEVVRHLLRTRANSIEGGTSEIQRNIVAERLLGLPREPDPFRGMPWDEVARS